MACPSEAIFLGFTQFSIDRELTSLALIMLVPTESIKPIKGGMYMEA